NTERLEIQQPSVGPAGDVPFIVVGTQLIPISHLPQLAAQKPLDPNHPPVPPQAPGSGAPAGKKPAASAGSARAQKGPSAARESVDLEEGAHQYGCLMAP